MTLAGRLAQWAGGVGPLVSTYSRSRLQTSGSGTAAFQQHAGAGVHHGSLGRAREVCATHGGACRDEVGHASWSSMGSRARLDPQHLFWAWTLSGRIAASAASSLAPLDS